MFTRFKEKFKTDVNYCFVIFSFLMYLIILLWLLILKYNNPKTINVLLSKYINFNLYDRFMYQFRHTYVDSQTIRQIFLNIPIFIPLTLYLPLLFKKQNVIRDISLTIFFSLSIELFQLFFALGGFEFLDILMNLLGGLFGILIFTLLYKHTSNLVINWINVVIVVLAIPCVIYIIINTGLNYKLYIPFFSGRNFVSYN